MNSFSRFIALSFLLILVGIICYAQNPNPRNLAKADKSFFNKAYAEAIPKYLDYLKQDTANAPAILKLADCYRLVNDVDHAEIWYRKVVTLKESEPIHRLYLGQILMQNGKYEEAKNWISIYEKEAGNDSRGREHLETLTNLRKYFRDSIYYQVKRININSLDADFCPVIYKNGIVFTSSRVKVAPVTRQHSWTGRNFFSIYFASKKDSLTFNEPVIFAPGLQTIYNDGPVSLSKDLKSMYFTRNNMDGKSSDKIVKLKIFEAVADKDGRFEDDRLTAFPYNNNEYSCAHPSLSQDGSKLYFSSDMEGGFGGMDIYVSNREGNSWTKPVNLGAAINSRGNEVFPYIFNNTSLFFSSNGHDGLGGLDIFVTELVGDKISKPANIGSPINSSLDDFGLVFNPNGKEGYFSSNRLRKGTDDDIYQFISSKPKSIHLNGKVIFVKSNAAMEGVHIELRQDNDVIATTTSSLQGGFNFDNLLPEKEYTVTARKDGFTTSIGKLSTHGIKPEDSTSIALYTDNEIQFAVDGLVLDKDKLNNENDSLVLVNTMNGTIIQELMAEDTRFHFDLKVNSKYDVYAKRGNIRSNVVSISTIAKTNSKVFTALLQMGTISDCDRQKTRYFVENIYFDLNTSAIREDVLNTLNRMVKILTDAPDLTLSLSSPVNTPLMKERLAVISNHLKSNAIAESRVSVMTRDQEKTSLCPDSKYCSETAQQADRKIVVSFFKDTIPVFTQKCIPDQVHPVCTLKGIVYSEETKKIVSGVKIVALNINTKTSKEIYVRSDGRYEIELDTESKYLITATKDSCASNAVIKSTVGIKAKSSIAEDFSMLCEGDIIKIDKIYYDVNKSTIRADAARELDLRLLPILNKYPSMKIELRSNTDCRSSKEYNQTLSDERAKAAVDYLISKGIDPSRLEGKGYGESNLLNRCECEGAIMVPCTEKQHQINRRTEFRIISLE